MARHWWRWGQLGAGSTDQNDMDRRRSVARSSARPVWLWIGVVLIAITACGTTGFDRADAVSALQTTGVTEAEATCMADSLLALDLLHAADPRLSRTSIEQDALVSSAARCVSREAEAVHPDTMAAEVHGATESVASAQQGDRDVLIGVQSAEPDVDQIRTSAIEHLGIFGMSQEKAACVVDRLLDADAAYLLEDPDFGRGLDSIEASAFASCI